MVDQIPVEDFTVTSEGLRIPMAFRAVGPATDVPIDIDVAVLDGESINQNRHTNRPLPTPSAHPSARAAQPGLAHNSATRSHCLFHYKGSKQ
jgi:hypothetical protein